MLNTLTASIDMGVRAVWPLLSCMLVSVITVMYVCIMQMAKCPGEVIGDSIFVFLHYDEPRKKLIQRIRTETIDEALPFSFLGFAIWTILLPGVPYLSVLFLLLTLLAVFYIPLQTKIMPKYFSLGILLVFALVLLRQKSF